MNPNKNPNIFAPKDNILKTCDACDYICSKPSEWYRHLSTRKHMALTIPNNESIENAPSLTQLYTCKCGKKYKHRSTLSHHRKQCSQIHHHALEDTPYLVSSPNNMPQIEAHSTD